MKDSNRTIIDVRSEGEFAMGHAQDALNIPLNEVEARAEEIAKIEGEIILCCASGNRSGMAQQILQSKGIDCHNGGSWFAAENYALAL
ncbi:MAG: rhodanese-like domain-containing protein [Bacteroidetes bacterium]|nr:MAG: rhodanese-like domain-containing protein [Bacteroidota bacterium]